jgi:cytidylate kinase
MAERLVVAIVGSPGTGKSTMARYMHRVYGFEVFEGGATIKAAAREQGITVSERSEYDEFMRDEQIRSGMSWLSDRLLARSGDRLLHAGMRSKHDFKRVKDVGGTVIGLVCPPEICVSRIDTSDPKNPKTAEEYVAHQLLEESPDTFGSHTGWCVRNADYQIDTSVSPEQSFKSLETFVEIALRVAPYSKPI